MSVLEELNGNITEYEYQKRQERKQERKRKRDAKILKALEDVRAEIEANMESIIGKYDSNTKPEDMPSRKIERNKGRTEAIDIIDRKVNSLKTLSSNGEYLESIDRKVNEVKHDCTACEHSDEVDGSNCYECVKGMADNFEVNEVTQ